MHLGRIHATVEEQSFRPAVEIDLMCTDWVAWGGVASYCDAAMRLAVGGSVEVWDLRCEAHTPTTLTRPGREKTRNEQKYNK